MTFPSSLTSESGLRLVMLAFAVICVLWGVLRGVGRLVILTLSLAAGIAAYGTFSRYAPGPLISWLNGFHAEAIQWGALICGILAAWCCLRFLTSLFNGPASHPTGAGPRTRAGLFSLIPALLIVWGAAMAVRWSGGVSRMRWVESMVRPGSGSEARKETPPLLIRLRNGVSTGVLGQVLDRVDPFHSRETSALGALLVLRRDEQAWQNLLRQPRLAPLVESGTLRTLSKDNDVLHALSFSHYSKLLTLPELEEAVRSPAVRDALRALPVEDAVLAALSGTAALEPVPRATVVP